jgi:hypothetical protein
MPQEASIPQLIAGVIGWLVWAAPLLQATIAAGLLFVAWRSLTWAKKTFEQKEQHEAAKDEVRAAFWLSSALLDPGQLVQAMLQGQSFVIDDDIHRITRWRNTFIGGGRDPAILSRDQFVSCQLGNIGPGFITYAEIPYTVEIFDKPPQVSDLAVEHFAGTFRFYYVVSGNSKWAMNGLTTTPYPYVRITLGHAVLHDIRSRQTEWAPDQIPEKHQLEIDNSIVWDLRESARPFGAAARPPQPGT